MTPEEQKRLEEKKKADAKILAIMQAQYGDHGYSEETDPAFVEVSTSLYNLRFLLSIISSQEQKLQKAKEALEKIVKDWDEWGDGVMSLDTAQEALSNLQA